METSKRLNNKVCFITGGSRGIGRAIAEDFAKHGAVVYVNARSEGSIDQWAVECSNNNNTEVIPIYFDITNYAEAKKAIMRIKKEKGKIDVLVNNAGIGYNDLIGMISLEKVKELFDVNVFALINLLQLAARLMTRNKSGSIINISSNVGLKGNPGQLAYAGSKGAVIAITKSAAKELAQHNIRVNSVAPGLVDTDMLREADEKKMEDRISRIGMGRLAKPIEIAEACTFLASDQSAYISGQVISVDGCSLI